ncbi:hypothetical protein NM208_g6434 [Fusarium decemcellulare]|uniref:Uncharacterized protein n=1 Tax=Fusarium decemcellulare TaxID=57161 RepID=A0ACC1SDB3_9HYPO|nr:hypothetical protein NM208_g6434 [Fusarium decemcellulare]
MSSAFTSAVSIITAASILATFLFPGASFALAVDLEFGLDVGVDFDTGSTARQCVDNLRAAGLGERLYYPNQTVYETRTSAYWSNSQHMRPWSIIRPESAEEVSATVKTLAKSSTCKFAVRSGGHIAWEGGSNIEDGITIDLGALNGVTFNNETRIASIEPGSRWTEVYEKLDKYGVVVAGGRDGDVGVGGYTLGGGKSWYIPRVGWACDQVVNYQVVLADGRIVEANKDEHADLFLALKGGSANFGIVTRFDFQTLDETRLWGGMRVMSKSSTPQQIESLVEFTANIPNDIYSSYVVLWNYQPSLGDIAVTAMLANTKAEEKPAAMKRLLAIPAIMDTTKQTTLAQVAAESEQPYGYYNSWNTITIKNDPETIQKAIDLHEIAVQNVKAKSPSGDFSTMCLFQPLPTLYSKRSLERGGNVMGLEQITEDAIIFMAGMHVSEAEMKDYGDTQAKEWLAGVEEFARDKGTFVDWMFLNYANKDQKPIATFGDENIAAIKAAAAKYDPTGVFQKQCPGGYKISQL